MIRDENPRNISELNVTYGNSEWLKKLFSKIVMITLKYFYILLKLKILVSGESNAKIKKW